MDVQVGLKAVKEMSLRDKVDYKIDLIKTKVERIGEFTEKINKILLPLSTDKIVSGENRPEPQGWFENHLAKLEHIEFLLGYITDNIIRLLNAVEDGKVVM